MLRQFKPVRASFISSTFKHIEKIKQYIPSFHSNHNPVHIHHRLPNSLSHPPCETNIQEMEEALAAIVSGKDIYLT